MTAVRIAFKRDTDKNFKKFDPVLHRNEMVCVLSEEQNEIFKNATKFNSEEIYGIRVPYKLGDGIHKYSELPFEEAKIPVVIEMYPDTDNKRRLVHKS